MFTSLKRVIRAGYRGFTRNIGISMATISIMVMVIFLISLLFVFNSASKELITNVQKKVDVSIYFKNETFAEDILKVKSELLAIPEVKEVEYVSKEEALENFVSRYKDDPVLMETLTEVGENPFFASLNVRAQQASQYEQVINFLQKDSYREIINKIDYHKRKESIEKIFSITSSINNTGIFLGIVLGLISVLIAFNAVRLAIYNSKEEISTMRLVGATNWFVQGPFLVQGVIVGFLAVLITLVITFGACYGIDSQIKTIAPEITTLGLLWSNLGLLILIQLAVGIGLGIISSMVAIRKYINQ